MINNLRTIASVLGYILMELEDVLYGDISELGASHLLHPTTGAAVTRTADVLTMPTGSWYNTSRNGTNISFTDSSLNRAPFLQTYTQQHNPYLCCIKISFNIYNSSIFHLVVYMGIHPGQSIAGLMENDLRVPITELAVTDTSGTVPTVTNLLLEDEHLRYLTDHIKKSLLPLAHLTPNFNFDTISDE
ncbi:MAG: hypothetical protein H6857_03205 [Rhodospirillales bacterium]|nr:hypothetical protein [Rhodospirillales bacterium]